MAAVHHRRELRLLQLVGLAVHLPARRLHPLEPAAGGADLARPRPVPAQGAPRPRARRQPRRARLLQVLRLLRLLDRQPAVGRRAGRAPGAEVDRAPGRDLLLHVHGDQLRRRRVPRRLRAHDPRAVRRVPLVLPPSRRRPDRPPLRADPADRQAARPPPGRHEPGLLPDRDGPLQEGGDRELPRVLDRRPGVRRARPALVARDPDRRLRLRGADLRGLLGLHGHRDRDRAPARLHVPAELRLAVRGRVRPGLLATLAHDALALAARLRLHPARRQPREHAPHLPQPAADHADRRPLARGGLDVRRLGRAPRHGAGLRALAPRAARRGRPRGEPGGRAGAPGSSRSTSSASPGSSSAPTPSAPPGT